jgi:hypothetical protein
VIRRRAALVFPVRQRAQPVGDVDFADRRVDDRRESLREDLSVSTVRSGVVVVSVIAGLRRLLLLVL